MTFKLQQDVSLQPYNTMAVPALAEYLVEVDTVQTLVKSVEFAKEKQLKLLVLGGGSNTLFTKNYQGLILLNRLLGIECLQDNESSVVVKVSAGENWHSFVAYAIERGWYGLENLALIPGLVGAAPIQNIGAYGAEVKDSIIAVDFVDFEQLEQISMTNSECQFGYRDSVFKHALRDKGVITSVTLCLSKKPELRITYPALQDYMSRSLKSENPTTKDVFNAVIAIRSDKLPSPTVIPNVGSFFKNPIVDAEHYAQIKKEYPNVVSFRHKNGYKLAAAWLIETAGWKSKTIDQVSVHAMQALVIVNPNKVEGTKILNFANQLRANIHQKFGIRLEIEPNIV